MDTKIKQMEIDHDKIISGLQYMLEESKVAKANINASNEFDRMRSRIYILEEEMKELKEFISKRLK